MFWTRPELSNISVKVYCDIAACVSCLRSASETASDIDIDLLLYRKFSVNFIYCMQNINYLTIKRKENKISVQKCTLKDSIHITIRVQYCDGA